MVKHRLRDSMKSLFRSHIDPEKEEQLKGAKGEIQDKVKRILKLVRDEHVEDDDTPLEPSKKESLVKLIEDFHSQYQSLYAKYDNLTDELRKKIIGNGKQEKESFSSSSDSDSDYSSMDKDSKNGQLENEFQKTINGMKQELQTVHMEVAELNQKLTMTSEEKEDLMKKLESTKNESSSKIADLSSQINNLLDERGRLHAQKIKAEEEINEARAQIMVLTTQVDNLQKEKGEVILHCERTKDAHAESLVMLENERNGFATKALDLDRALEEREGAYEKLNEEYKQIDNWYKECKVKLEAAEKKIQVMTEEFHSKDQMVADLEQTTEDLKRDLEEKGDEINNLHENLGMLEVKLRMSNQKLRVADQLLSEKEEGFREVEEKFLKDQRSLEERIAKLSATVAVQEDAYQEIVFSIKASVNSAMTGIENIVWKFEDACKNYEKYISNMSHELHIARNYVREMNKEKVRLKEDINHLEEQLQDKKNSELDLRQMVEKLEEKAIEEELAKKNLRTNVVQLEKTIGELQKLAKEKDEGILELAEEKREAIRQLCLGIDYHRSRYDYLMEVVSKTRRG
ncbi:hypothetical protein PIB30_038761 [Stylosanthes scabra]|uniref:NAB domain-containing protein n=1 Tax=Stylosanthes scabra TaxID=79078 RepID=A0ABU6WE36_9FABA|nr:hypothetical protein [Stylosanthes scabra]